LADLGRMMGNLQSEKTDPTGVCRRRKEAPLSPTSVSRRRQWRRQLKPSGVTALTLGNGPGWVLFLYLTRFLAGMGIGGEYAAINSAIDELIPARYRGRVDIAVNGTYWAGAVLGTLGTFILFNTMELSLA
jgi:MFS family permease